MPHSPLPLTLARAALASPLRRRPTPESALPATRLTAPAAPADPARLAAYAEVCGCPTTDPLPLAYPHVLGFPLAMRLMAGRGFPLPLPGLVHTWIDIEAHRRLHPTDPLELTVYAKGLAAHRRGTEVTIVTEARLEGETVWESRSGYLARHRVGDAGTRPPARDTGLLPATAVWSLPGDLGRRYAAASGDRNPIHLHPLGAKLFGFPRTVAHGMWTFARCLAEADTGGQPARARAEFRAPVLLPCTVTHAAGGGAFQLRSKDRIHLSGEISG
ncbi:MaoC family dehydratase [Streptomyces sp. NBC_00344]|uniref:MaoC family dehydratase n=1 Tax=Streptomyces sp. NBC_00344 TaxID=2975720 RepID=UPI002E1B613D